jgi:hypothetical protein
MRDYDSAIAGNSAALPDLVVPLLALLGGAALLALGIGTWAGRWYSPLLRSFNGVHPLWLGPALACFGAALTLVAAALLVPVPDVRTALFGWASLACVQAVPCLLAGLALREVEVRPAASGMRRRPGRLRRALRYLLTHQSPAGGQVWPDRRPRCRCGRPEE